MRVFYVLSAVLLCPLALEGAETSARKTAEQTLAALDSWLVRQPRGDTWRQYFAGDAWRAEVFRTGRPDREQLAGGLERLRRNAEGLDRLRHERPVVAWRQSLERWLASESLPAGPGLAAVVASILNQPPGQKAEGAPLQQQLRSRLVALLGLLRRYASEPTDEDARLIAAYVDSLAADPAAAPLVAAVRDYYGHPNVWIDLSEDLLDDSVAGQIESREAIQNVILGTPVTGEGKLRAVRTLAIEPRQDMALLKIMIQGSIDSNTVGRSGPVRIDSHCLTEFRAEKAILLSAGGVRLLPAECNAETRTLSSQVSSHVGGLRGRVVRRVGQRRSEELRWAADQESSRHARQRLIKSVDERAEAVRERLESLASLSILTLKHLSGSSHVVVCSERDVLRFGTIVGPLGAPPGGPRCDARRLATIHFHDSLANRLARGAGGELVQAGLANHLQPAFGLLAPAKTYVGGERSALLYLVGNPPAAPRRWLGPALPDTWRPQTLLLGWLKRTFDPRLTANGVSLRGGRWGIISAASSRGAPEGPETPGRASTDVGNGKWLGVEWRPVVQTQRVARFRSATTE
ncbi:MAG TPA: hypothetical protein VHC22_27235 [Pirellulales bacterium]|nr:hypothetical protein [Pirellulales bacterium]